MASKTDDERHEEIVAAVLAAGLIQKQATGTSHNTPEYIVNLHRRLLAELRKPCDPKLRRGQQEHLQPHSWR
jgi:hypothetical protein